MANPNPYSQVPAITRAALEESRAIVLQATQRLIPHDALINRLVSEHFCTAKPVARPLLTFSMTQ